MNIKYPALKEPANENSNIKYKVENPALKEPANENKNQVNINKLKFKINEKT